uniref:Uncharacterized protein n=1 Tax=mine drainage metagenome TaxID=410659 RepID=E6Q057_9ZZZZ
MLEEARAAGDEVEVPVGGRVKGARIDGLDAHGCGLLLGDIVAMQAVNYRSACLTCWGRTGWASDWLVIRHLARRV